MRASATKTGGERETNEGASREGKDVGREGRNRSLMRWWGSYVRLELERERGGREEGMAWLSTSARRVRKTSRMTIDHPSPRNEHQRVH